MDSIVQLIRNALCVTKDLHLFNDTFLWNSTIPTQYYDLPEPFNKTTPLEVFISIAQAYVLYSGIPFSLQLLLSNHGKLIRIQRIMNTYGNTIQSGVDRIINASLLQEAYKAVQTMFVGFNVFFISCSFVWLAGNSWHITETNIIGGLPALIHALSVMNICLTPLLYYMYKDGYKIIQKANYMETIVTTLQQSLVLLTKSSSSSATTPIINKSDMNLITLEILLPSWEPFWSKEVGGLFFLSQTIYNKSTDSMEEKKLIADEKEKIQEIFDIYCNDKNATTNTTRKSNNISSKIQETITDIQSYIPVKRLEGYRELIYTILNFIAWYGYGMCIIVYYFDSEMKQPMWMRKYMLFSLSNNDADYYGNLAGDCMWTIEPTIALLSPYYFNYIYNKTRSKLTTTTTTAKAKKE